MPEATLLTRQAISESLHAAFSSTAYDVPRSQDENSEAIIGEWMDIRGNRDQMVIATKVNFK
jgi:aryl-alcohol dehydrogenase-like predicted oxidoreductase